MKIGMICFTARGAEICSRLFECFTEKGDDCLAFMPERFLPLERDTGRMRKSGEVSLTQWSRQMFEEKRAMVFIGASGIAVRAIAPWVKDKLTDPPVIAVDEMGRFSVPLLSGHVGGANELAVWIGDVLGAIPVITTATDINGLFAVDLFAAGNGLAITDREKAKTVSASLLEGEAVGFFSDFPLKELPEGFVPYVCRQNVWITVRSGKRKGPEILKDIPDHASFLRLVPSSVILGIGCRKGTEEKCLKKQVFKVLEENDIDEKAILAAASIDIKKSEEAILNLAGEYGWKLRFYGAETLLKVPGTFEESAFVRETVGVGNVCERAACAGGGTLLIHKQAGEGVTVAAACELPQSLDIRLGFGRKS